MKTKTKIAITLFLLSIGTYKGVYMFKQRNTFREERDIQREANRKEAIEKGLDTPELRAFWKERDEAREARRTESENFRSANKRCLNRRKGMGRGQGCSRGQGRGMGRGRRNEGCPFNN